MELKTLEMFLSKLCCPGCGGDLSLSVETTENEKIKRGGVSCSLCETVYPIYEGVLELIHPALQYGGDGGSHVPKEQLAQRRHFDNWAVSDRQNIDQFKRQNAIRVGSGGVAETLRKKMDAGKFLLDVGCGAGQEAVAYAKAGGYVAGFEISRNLIKSSMALAEKERVAARAIFFVADADALPCKAECWDYVTTLGVLHHVPSPGDLCVAIQRALKPGGFHYFVENNKSLLRPIFDWMMRKKPLWEEEAGEYPLISEEILRDWTKDIANMEMKVDYLYYLPPHLLNVLPFMAAKFLYDASNAVCGAIPGVKKTGGIIKGTLVKTPSPA